MNAIRYAELNNQLFKRIMAECGYTTFTTFFGDLSTAEFVSGEKGVRETYRSVIKNWMGDIKYITEFYMALNHKIWQHYAYHNGKSQPIIQMDFDTLAHVYNELWEDCENKIMAKYENDKKALDYFFRVTD